MAKKSKFRVVGIVLVVVALVLMLIGSFADRAIKGAVEKAASKALGVEVTIDDIALSIFGGSVEIEGLVVANPEGYSDENFLELGQAEIEVAIGSLLSDTVEIERITFADVKVLVEQKGFTNNLQALLDSLPDKETVGEAKTEETGQAKDIQIKLLELKNIQVDVKLLVGKVPLKIESIEMRDLGTDDKLSIARLTGMILVEIAAGIAREGAGLLPTEMLGPLSSRLQEQGVEVLKVGKDILEKSKVVGEGVLEGGKDVGEEVLDLFKGLLKKKGE